MPGEWPTIVVGYAGIVIVDARCCILLATDRVGVIIRAVGRIARISGASLR